MKKTLFDASLVAQAQGHLARRSVFNFVSKIPGAAPAARAGNSWYRMNRSAADATSADILIYDEIGIWGVSASDFVRDFAEMQVEQKPEVINVHINSPGGSVFDGIAIYNALAQSDSKVIVHIEGWAASIASVIAMAGDEINIGEAAQFMIHQPWSFVIGPSDDMRKEADVLDSLESAIVDVYVARTGGGRAQIEAWVKAETWFKGKAAVDAGFADSVIPLKLKTASAKPAARVLNDLFGDVFKNLPDEVRENICAAPKAAESITTEREFQNFLRERGGFSGAQAKAIASNGFKTAKEPLAGAKPAEEPTSMDPPGEAVERAVYVAAIRLAAQTFPRI